MAQPTPNMDPFTEDPTKEKLTDYAEFIKTAYTPMFCEHKVTDSKMHVPGDGFNTKGNMIRLTSENKEEGEGSIYQKDLYTFCHKHLGKEDDLGEESQHPREESSNRRGYWLIEVTDPPRDTTLPLPVFQFGTLGLEVFPADKGVIKLGTWDVELMLRTCTEYKGGKKIMPKLSGSAVSDGKLRFRWCLRGPTISSDPDQDDGGGLFKKEKLRSLFRKADFRK